MESTALIDKVSEEIVCLDQVTHVVENVSFEPVTLNTKHTILESVKGTVKPPTSVPKPPAQCRMDPSHDYHFFTGEYIGRPGTTGHSESHDLINIPQFNTWRSHNSVPLTSPETCSMSEKLQHLDNTQVADNQALNITSNNTIHCHYFCCKSIASHWSL